MLRKSIEKFIPFNEQEESDKRIILKYMDTFDNLLVRDNEFAHFTASSWIVNKDRTKVLMIYHNIYDSWAWVGGHADGNGDLLYVAKKEIEEETGLTNIKLLHNGIYGLAIITVDGHIKRGKYVSSHLHLDCSFLFEANELDELKIKEDENSDVKWVNIDEAIKITNEQKMIPIYNKLKKKLKNVREI